jgi:hypothetical protein
VLTNLSWRFGFTDFESSDALGHGARYLNEDGLVVVVDTDGVVGGLKNGVYRTLRVSRTAGRPSRATSASTSSTSRPDRLVHLLRFGEVPPDFSEKTLGYRSFLQSCKAAETSAPVDLRWSLDADDYLLTAGSRT